MTAAVRRGRPRDETIDAAILAAAVDELRERGFAAMSMESVAARAGVAKTTVYRRWPNATDLGVEALRTFVEDASPPPDGSARDQLLFLLERMRRKWNDPTYAAIMRRVAADANINPDAFQDARAKLIGPHIRLMERALRRCVDEGVIRADTDIAWVRRMLVSPVTAAALVLTGPVSRAELERTLDTVLRGLAP